MAFTWLELAKWSGLITSPIFMFSLIGIGMKSMVYRLKRRHLGGRGIRIFYVGPNGMIESDYCTIGTEYSDKLIEFKKKTFIYNKSSVRTLPAGLARFSGEKFLWYTYDNIAPHNVNDIKQKKEYSDLIKELDRLQKLKDDGKLDDKKVKDIHLPMDVTANFNMKTPEELYAAMATKAFKDTITPEKQGMPAAASYTIAIIAVGAIVYLICKKMGWI